MRFFSYLFFCFLLFLHQSFIFTQVAKGHEDWSAIEIQRFSETLDAVGVARESILSLIAATDYQEIQRITSFFKTFHQPNKQQSKNSTAADVFSYYVFNEQDIDIDTVMGGNWDDKLIKDTQDWTVIEAESFIRFLKSEGLEFDNILVILKATDYLHAIRTNQAVIILEEKTVSTSEVVNQVYQQTEEVPRQIQTGSDVFIHFAREQFRRELEEKGSFLEGEEFEDAFKRKMGKKGQWEKKIIEDAEHSKWTISDAQQFLDFLKERIGESATLKAIKTVSFFHNATYENFQLRFDVFLEYVDRERIVEQLANCLTCFSKGKPEVIRGVIEVVREYFEEEGESVVKEALNKNVIVFSLSENQITKLRELLDFLESYIGKEGVKDIILNKPASFTFFRVKTQKHLNGSDKIYILQLPLVVEYLENYIEREAVQKIMQKSFQGLARAELRKLRAVVEYIEGYFESKESGQRAVREIMQKSFKGLALAELEKLRAIVEYIEGYFESKESGQKIVQEIMQKSFTGLALAELEKLQAVVEYIKGYFESKESGQRVVREIMQKSFKGLALAELEKLRAVVEYIIEDYFENKESGQRAVREMMQDSFYGLAVAELEKLKDVAKYIEGYFEDEGKAAVQKIMQNSFAGLARAELEKLKAVVEYIEKYFEDEGKVVVQEMMQKTFQGFAVAELEKLKDVIEYIERYFEDEGKAAVQKIM